MLGPTFNRTLAGAFAALPQRPPCVAVFDRVGRVTNAMAVIDADPVLARRRRSGRLKRAAQRRQRAAHFG